LQINWEIKKKSRWKNGRNGDSTLVMAGPVNKKELQMELRTAVEKGKGRWKLRELNHNILKRKPCWLQQ
jgi:hypothetical protein